MEATFGDSVTVRYNLWVSEACLWENVVQTAILKPGPTPGPLFDVLLGATVGEARWCHAICGRIWEPTARPENFDADTPLSFELTILNIVKPKVEKVVVVGGSVTDRMKRVDPTMAARYKQRSGQ
jgi:hypothetical protein